MNQKQQKNICIFLMIVLLWICFTSVLQSFFCPKMTQTELFLHTFKSFIFDFNHCN